LPPRPSSEEQEQHAFPKARAVTFIGKCRCILE
jgi:hypothetical protein